MFKSHVKASKAFEVPIYEVQEFSGWYLGIREVGGGCEKVCHRGQLEGSSTEISGEWQRLNRLKERLCTTTESLVSSCLKS